MLPLPGAGTLWGLCVSERPTRDRDAHSDHHRLSHNQNLNHSVNHSVNHVLVVDNFRQAVIVLELCDVGVSW